MRSTFLYPLTSRARDVFYKSPPAPTIPTLEVLVGPITCSSRLGTGLISGMGDTEDLAILRIFPSPDTGWSSYQAPDAGGCCTARIASRGPGVFSFQFRQVRFQVVVTGQVPGSRHTIAVDIMRRVDGSGGVWIKYATLELDATADVSGVLDFTGLVPNGAGYESYVTWASSPPGTCSNGTSGGSGGSGGS